MTNRKYIIVNNSHATAESAVLLVLCFFTPTEAALPSSLPTLLSPISSFLAPSFASPSLQPPVLSFFFLQHLHALSTLALLVSVVFAATTTGSKCLLIDDLGVLLFLGVFVIEARGGRFVTVGADSGVRGAELGADWPLAYVELNLCLTHHDDLPLTYMELNLGLTHHED